MEQGTYQWCVVGLLAVLVILAIAETGVLASLASDGFQNNAKSDLVKGMYSAGASLRSQGQCRDDGSPGQMTDCPPIGYSKKSSFLGGPEPPVFYDIGVTKDQLDDRYGVLAGAKDNFANWPPDSFRVQYDGVGTDGLY